MRPLIIMFAVFFLSVAPVRAAGSDCGYYSFKKNYCCIGDYDLEVRDGAVYFYEDSRHRNEVKITGDYELFVNGKQIDLDDGQKEMAKAIYTQAVDLDKKTREIARESVKIGAAGAAIGIQAAAGVLKLLRSDYDAEDLERELECKAEKIEARADELDELANQLDDDARELERQIDKMEKEISEVRDL